MINRAKQFMPFDALRGFKEAIKEKEKIIVERKALTEEDLNIINQNLSILKPGMMVKVSYYDEENDCILFEGLVSFVDPVNMFIRIVKTKIYFKSLVSIEIINK